MSITPYIGDMNIESITFGPFENRDGKTKVEVYRDASSTQRSNRLNRIALCPDAMDPFVCPFGIDNVRDDSANPYRRGLAITITDPATLDSMRKLDEHIVASAVANSKEWFKGKTLTEADVRLRYQPILGKFREEDVTEGIKIKIKCPGSDYPTALHLRDETGQHHKTGGRIDHLTKGARVVPIVSASYGLWFMGGGSKFGLTMQAEEMIVVPGAQDSDNLSQFASSRPLEMAKRPRDDDTSEEPNAKRPEPVSVELEGEDAGPM